VSAPLRQSRQDDIAVEHRIAARALAGEVLVTRPGADGIGSTDLLDLEPIGEVNLKGLPEATELFVVRAGREGG